jgi:hypothetical protein
MIIRNDSATGAARLGLAAAQLQTPAAALTNAQQPSTTLHDLPIDYGVTGSISSGDARISNHRPAVHSFTENAPHKNVQASTSYHLRFVHKGMAIVQGAHGLYATWPGAKLPGAGKVVSIERRGNTWILLTDSTTITEADSHF